jgi:regulatory protein
MEEDKEFVRARDCAYRLLRHRQRTVQELTGRLEEKGFSSTVIKKTVEDLSRQNYLNDEKFARAWMEYKSRTSPVGYAVLREELRRKGIAEELLEKVITDFSAHYNEYETARDLAVAQRRCYPGLDSEKLKKKLYAYLNRRGFPREIIEQVLETG